MSRIISSLTEINPFPEIHAQQRAVRSDLESVFVGTSDEEESSDNSEEESADDEDSKPDPESGSRLYVGSSTEEESAEEEDSKPDPDLGSMQDVERNADGRNTSDREASSDDDDDEDSGDEKTESAIDAVIPSKAKAKVDAPPAVPAVHLSDQAELRRREIGDSLVSTIITGTKHKASDPPTTQIDIKRPRLQATSYTADPVPAVPTREVEQAEDLLSLLERHLDEQLSKAQLG